MFSKFVIVTIFLYIFFLEHFVLVLYLFHAFLFCFLDIFRLIDTSLCSLALYLFRAVSFLLSRYLLNRYDSF